VNRCEIQIAGSHSIRLTIDNDLPFTIYYLNMKYNILGSTGLKVSELCLGTMTFGENFFNIGVVSQASANEMVGRARCRHKFFRYS